MKKAKSIFYVILTILILGYFFSKIIYRALADILLSNNPQTTKAVIINVKNYLPNSHVTFHFRFLMSSK